MGPVGKVIIGGITITAVVYVLLAYAQGAGQAAASATSAYAKIARTARGE